MDKKAAVDSKHELGKEQNQILAAQIGSQQELKNRELDQKQESDIATLQLEIKKLAEAQTDNLTKMKVDFEREMADRMKDLQIAELNATVTHHANVSKTAQAQAKDVKQQAAQASKPKPVVDPTLSKSIVALAKQVSDLMIEEQTQESPRHSNTG